MRYPHVSYTETGRSETKCQTIWYGPTASNPALWGAFGSPVRTYVDVYVTARYWGFTRDFVVSVDPEADACAICKAVTRTVHDFVEMNAN